MNSKKFSEAVGELDTRYVDEAIGYKKKKTYKKPVWVKLGGYGSLLMPSDCRRGNVYTESWE